ncbi:zinc ribbon domain-containing protein [Dictyobacter arantiisoli]|uniref:Zinc-ribbon domain-containing protein n=1 Tax=Dictyobacter arantiisoli TaxID=2014874 RepID=A0A5A5THX9_9CHLR|nr:zinc ribbon domain-containing protein [Dictyobacter arantiisoli]GCF10987.1 hypothetical protein KDI_45510 [Dictyobacter arantiisoli]
MLKPITGQYECVHSAGVGLEYFTSRIDRLVLQADGRFVLTIQNRSRAINAAQSFIKGEQATTVAPETRLEGTYSQQDLVVSMLFANGGSEQAQLAPDGSTLQVGPNKFTKVSDSTFLPPTHRLQKDMDDIAKGLKIASTLGGMAVKAVKTVQGTIQAVQGSNTNTNTNTYTPPTNQGAPSVAPNTSRTPQQPLNQPYYQPATPPVAPAGPPPHNNPIPPQLVSTTAQPTTAPIFCDQCGARARPGKRFCNNCGARLP